MDVHLDLCSPHVNVSVFVLLFCRLRGCGVTDEGCAALSSALRSNSSHLRELDLIGNNVGDAGLKMLSALKDDPHNKLEKLM